MRLHRLPVEPGRGREEEAQVSDRPTPVTDALLATPEARDRYLGLRDPSIGYVLVLNTYACVVDIVRATELAGGDALAALRDYLLAVDCETEARYRREYERILRTVEPQIITPTDRL